MLSRPLFFLTALLGSATSLPAEISTEIPAQDWLAWQGCWKPDGSNGELLCVIPDGDGVRMITTRGVNVIAESRVVADGRTRSVKDEACSGTERAQWSRDHRRVFLTSSLECDGVRRDASGVFAFSKRNEWVSVQAVTIDGRTATRTVRYSAVEPVGIRADIAVAARADRVAREDARIAMLTPVEEDGVDEAANMIDEVAVNEWLRVAQLPYRVGDEYAAQTDDVVYGSALSQSGYGSNVRVVERPVYIERTTYVTHYVRDCWDPFYAGFVVGVSRHVSIGVGTGRAYCGSRYYAAWSPWGYDYYGWRYIPRPYVVRTPVYVNRRPIIIHRTNYDRRDHNDRRDDDRWRDNDHRRDNNDHRATPARREQNDRGRVTDRDRGRNTNREWYNDRNRGSSERNRASAQPRSGRERAASSSTRTASRTTRGR